MTTIVLAWADNTGIKPTGRHVRRDGVNWFPEFESCLEGHACVWLNEGTSDDIDRAKNYLETLPYPTKKVYLFRPDEEKALTIAKRLILTEVTP